MAIAETKPTRILAPPLKAMRTRDFGSFWKFSEDWEGKRSFIPLAITKPLAVNPVPAKTFSLVVRAVIGLSEVFVVKAFP